jgi:cytochrome c551/c552
MKRSVIGSARRSAVAVAAASLVAAVVTAGDLPVIPLEEKPALASHVEQKDIAAGGVPFQKLFAAGDALFHTAYNGLDGVGAMRTAGGASLPRFSVGPAGGGQPIAVSAQACGDCHAVPFAAGAGHAHTRVLNDPDGDGKPPFNARATTSLHGDGLLQLLAMEMTEELQAARDAAAAEARKRPGTPVRRGLMAKGVEYGQIAATADAAGSVTFDHSAAVGVAPDLVVRPFGWKGFVPVLRSFVLVAANAAMGMQGEEFVWRLPPDRQPDADADGVARELTVGDITALTVYNASQETPQDVARLAALGMVVKPDAAALARVDEGRALFARVGCASCHKPELRLQNTVFEEPTRRGNGHYLDSFLASKDKDYDPARPVRVDMLKDAQPPRVERDPAGGAMIRLYGDLKWHHMGRQLAEGAAGGVFDSTLLPLEVDGKPFVVPADVFLTAELWGVGSTSPYLHDDRAGTLKEAILLHGEDAPPPPGDPGRSEAQEARDAFAKLSAAEQGALVSFLKSLVNFSPER